MNRINILLTLSTVNILLIIVERLSPTTQIILSPYSFLRLHEVLQMVTLILFSVLIPFFVLAEVTHNFEDTKTKKGLILLTTFITGVYFYATGNGLHEVASYLFNTFCDTKNFKTEVCSSMFFNDYYFGNILYFIGAYFMNIVVVLFEIARPSRGFNKREMVVLLINSVFYSIAIIAYAAFDRVLVGLIFSIIFMISVDYLLLASKTKFNRLPFTMYGAAAYTIATVVSLIIRFH